MTGKKIIKFPKDNIEATIEDFLSDYRAGRVKNMAIIWNRPMTEKEKETAHRPDDNDSIIGYNWHGNSTIKTLGLLTYLIGCVTKHNLTEEFDPEGD